MQSGGLKKSGRNDFAKYEYFELSDFIPTILRLENELGFFCSVSFNSELATLAISDTAKPEDYILFTSPMSSASLKGMHDVQNLGAVQTYIRRYLYVNAFEIVESDAVDRSEKREEQHKTGTENVSVKASKTTGLTKAQLEEFGKLCEQEGGEAKTRLKKYVESMGYAKLSLVPQERFEELKDTFLSDGLPFSMED